MLRRNNPSAYLHQRPEIAAELRTPRYVLVDTRENGVCAMKAILLAATVSFGLAGAAQAQENPMARTAPMISSCAANALGTKTSFMTDSSFMGDAAMPTNPSLCPGFLDGSVVKLPHRDLRT